jgi:cephalosporin hydroxylase
MKLAIDTTAGTLVLEDGGAPRSLPLYSPEAFAAISHLWAVVGWDQKYSYGFTWMGRPIVQLPEDIVRIQETIYRVRPDVVIETGVAHGGSLVLYAGIMKAMGHGRVVGIDIEIRPRNRQAIEAHELAPLIALFEGSSTESSIVERVRASLRPADRALVILDSNHTKAHVAAELEAYAPMVAVGSYIVATDGIMKDLADVPRGNPAWAADNPTAAAVEFAKRRTDFVLETPPFLFNEASSTVQVTHWPSAYLKRVS